MHSRLHNHVGRKKFVIPYLEHGDGQRCCTST